LHFILNCIDIEETWLLVLIPKIWDGDLGADIGHPLGHLCFLLSLSRHIPGFNVHGSVHRNNILVYKSQQDAQDTELILSDNCPTITHLQEHKTTATTASGKRYTVLLSAAIVKELELCDL
jgi:hypothetical protein